MRGSPQPEYALINWFAVHPTAANLLMASILVAGLVGAQSVRLDTAPELDYRKIEIRVPYPGSSVEEVEEGILLRLEEAVRAVGGVERTYAVAREDLATFDLFVAQGFSAQNVLDQVKIRVDAIKNFPKDIEEPEISLRFLRHHVNNLQLYGDLDERAQRLLLYELRAGLEALDQVSSLETYGLQPYEVSIEVADAQLRKYDLTLEDVATAVARFSVDLPGGLIRAKEGGVRVRTVEQRRDADGFASIVLIARPDGARVTLGEVAEIRDGFEENDSFTEFDGKPGLGLITFKGEGKNLLSTASAVEDFVTERKPELPPGVSLAIWSDAAYYLKSTLTTMSGNFAYGALLVVLVLMFFLDLRSVLWVVGGLPVAFLGAIALMATPFFDVSIDMVSLFGFILVLGILVDDSIVVAESVSEEFERNGASSAGAIEATSRVALPSTVGVLTTIAAFLPLTLVEGVYAPIPAAVGYVVVFALVFSLIESKLILPAHLAHSSGRILHFKGLERLRLRCATAMSRFAAGPYRTLVSLCVRRWRETIALFVGLWIVSFSLLTSGIVPPVVFADVPLEFLEVGFEVEDGSNSSRTREVIEQIKRGLERTESDYRAEAQSDRGFVRHLFAEGTGRSGHLTLELVKNEERSLTSTEILDRWREAVGPLAGVSELSFAAADDPAGQAVQFDLTGSDGRALDAAAAELADELERYAGVVEVTNGARKASEELRVVMKPEAALLGLSSGELAREVRSAFHGIEVQRFLRGTDEVKVVVRRPRRERESIASLEKMLIRLENGEEVPFHAVARLESRAASPAITRINGRRAVEVAAKVNKAEVSPREIGDIVKKEVLPGLASRHPGVSFESSGEGKEEERMAVSLLRGFGLAILAIYGILAVTLRSYVLPLLVMSVVPFGLIGAILGHLLLDLPMGFMSFFGVVALAGVLVNDSLLIVHFARQNAELRNSLTGSVVLAGVSRFRAVTLTSATTFFACLPILLETSPLGQGTIPMAVSLGFGVLFGTVISLLLVPALCAMTEAASSRSRAESRDSIAVACPPGAEPHRLGAQLEPERIF